jgi:hypothetical protein
MQSASLVNRRYRAFPKAIYMFEDVVFNNYGLVYADTGVTITPDNGKNLVFGRASCSAGSEGPAHGILRVLYDGTEIGISDLWQQDTGGTWNSNDLGMIKIVDSSGAGEIKLQAKASASNRSVDVGTQQLLTIPLDTMGLVEGVDYWYQEEYEDGDSPSSIEWSAGDNDVFPWAPGFASTNNVECSKLEWTAPETEVYLFFYSFESTMRFNIADGNHAVYVVPPPGWKEISSITRSGTTATGTVTPDFSWPWANNQWVHIEGADQSDYNGDYFQITITGANTFTYQVSGSPTTPATGTMQMRQETVSAPSTNNHISLMSGGVGAFHYQSYCWVSASTVAAGTAWAAITGKAWQGLGDVSVRRCRICVIKASSLTKGWGVGGQQVAAHSKTNETPKAWNPYESYGNGASFAAIEAVQGAPTMSQTYTPPGPGLEQTLVFGSLITSEPLDVSAPNSTCSYALRNATAGVYFAEDMSRPMPTTNTVSWTFGMAVIDDNDATTLWETHCREANNTGSRVLFRRGYVVIIGLDNA